MHRIAPGQGHDRMDVPRRERSKEMGEKIATPRFFPAQVASEHLCRNAEEDEIVAAGKMAPRRLAQLMGSGKMDVAILQIDRRARKLALRQGSLPFFAVTDLVDCRHPQSFAAEAIDHRFPAGNGTNCCPERALRRDSRDSTTGRI